MANSLVLLLTLYVYTCVPTGHNVSVQLHTTSLGTLYSQGQSSAPCSMTRVIITPFIAIHTINNAANWYLFIHHRFGSPKNTTLWEQRGRQWLHSAAINYRKTLPIELPSYCVQFLKLRGRSGSFVTVWLLNQPFLMTNY